jgi:hypothetical protein
MGTTYLHAVCSLDGYIANERDEVGPLRLVFQRRPSSVDDDRADVAVQHSASQPPGGLCAGIWC